MGFMPTDFKIQKFKESTYFHKIVQPKRLYFIWYFKTKT